MSNLHANVIATDDLFLGIDLIWSDGHGLGVRGWALSRRGALEEISLGVDGVTVPITKWYPRPDLLAVFPQCHASDRCGFEAHVSRQAQYGLTFQVQRQGKTIVLPMKVAASPPLLSDYTDASNLFNEFLAISNAPGMRVLEIGARIVSPGSVSKRALFPAASYTGFDYYLDENTDVAGDAHKLSHYFGAQRFDAIFSVAVLEHLAMPWVVALEINKLLAMGAVTFHSTVFAWPLHDAPWDFWRFSDAGLKVLFAPALGFEVIKAGLFHPARIYQDQVTPFQEMFPTHAAFCGVAILARKVAELDTSKFRWEAKTEEVATGHYPTKD